MLFGLKNIPENFLDKKFVKDLNNFVRIKGDKKCSIKVYITYSILCEVNSQVYGVYS